MRVAEHVDLCEAAASKTLNAIGSLGTRDQLRI